MIELKSSKTGDRMKFPGIILLGFTFTALLLGSARPVFSQESAVGVRVGIGNVATISELIRTPLQGKQLKDPTWIYEQFPDGTKNPDFPAPAQAPQTPSQPPVPNDLTDPGKILPNWGNSQKAVANSKDVLVPIKKLLYSDVVVVAWLEWQDSKIRVQAGDVVEISADGLWNSHPGTPMFGPEGKGPPLTTPNPGRAGHPPMPHAFAQSGTLLGKIGAGESFIVGKGTRFNARESGTLFFCTTDLFDGTNQKDAPCTYCEAQGINNNNHIGNNEGQVEVTITINP